MGRYLRQSRFAPLGEEGQQRISASTVAVVGLGALGSMQADLLARAGVGTLRLLDRDFVELSNLQRQTLYDESDAAEALPKAVAAARRLARVNSEIRLEPHVADLSPRNIEDLLDGADLILDATDNFETRYLINDFAVSRNLPWIYGAAVASYGLTLAILPGISACFRCVYPEQPQGSQPTCETEGVLGPVTATIGSLQAGTALKILARGAESVTPRLTRVDVWTGEIRQTAPPARDSDCPCCGARQPVRPQRRADSRTVAPGGSRPARGAFENPRRSPRERIRPASLRRPLRTYRLSRRQSHHKRHHRSGRGAQRLRSVHRSLAKKSSEAVSRNSHLGNAPSHALPRNLEIDSESTALDHRRSVETIPFRNLEICRPCPRRPIFLAVQDAA